MAKSSFRYCLARKKIAFLKTHKCASTTIQNILLRFGRINNLNFVLPAKGNFIGSKYAPFQRDSIKGTLWEKAGLSYDIFLLHTIWNHAEIANTLSDQGDVFYVSVIRDPVELFRSWWDYLRLDKRYNRSIEEYALNMSLNSRDETKKCPFGFN